MSDSRYSAGFVAERVRDDVELDRSAEPGDLVVVFQSGAYGRTASPRQFLGHPDVVEALV